MQIIPKGDLKKNELIGPGSYGEVYKGEWNGSDVAIKSFYIKSLPDYLRKEIESYANLRHPNLVTLYGICNDPGKSSKITELMEKSLRQAYLDPAFSDRQILEFGLQMAKGLEYLHSIDSVHKGLKSNNVLVDGNKVKLDDWGCSKIKLETSSLGLNDDRSPVSVRWRAPETFGRRYGHTNDSIKEDKAADVYSFGTLLWEMAAKRLPFEGKSESQIVKLLC